MPIRTSKILRVLALLFSLSLVAAACGSDDADETAAETEEEAPTEDTEADATTEDTESETPEEGEGEGEEATGEGAGFEQLDLSGVEITVGSKDFTEQLVLGELLVQAFEAAGASVTNQVDLGGTVVNREALLAGEINTYAEYNGTGWTEHLQRDYEELAADDGSVDPDALTEAVATADLEENSIQWIGQSPFNDTYGFASAPDLLDGGSPFTMQSMADYLEANPDTTLCLESEFPSRSDGLVLFEEATGYEVPESQITILDTGIIYTETQSGDCAFGEIFTTDGRIAALGLNLVEDPGVMIIYNVSITMPDELYQQAPEAFDQIAEQLFAPLDNATMTELNRLVDIEGTPAADVAATFLQEQGLVAG
jgi:osmoprotectant transport system substrate-binding protein